MRKEHTQEVENDPAVGVSASGSTEVCLAVGETVRRISAAREVDHVSGVGERVAEAKYSGIAAKGPQLEEEEEEEEDGVRCHRTDENHNHSSTRILSNKSKGKIIIFQVCKTYLLIDLNFK